MNVTCPLGVWLASLHWGTVAEIMTALATVGIVWVAFVQLRRFNQQTQADFTYKVYSNLREWVRSHPGAQAWLDDPPKTPIDDDRYDDWGIDEFLTFFEAVWGLWQRKLVDQELVYDLLSDDLISAYEANDRALEKIIRDIRTTPGNGDVFIGAENLYREMKKMTEKRNPPRHHAAPRGRT